MSEEKITELVVTKNFEVHPKNHSITGAIPFPVSARIGKKTFKIFQTIEEFTDHYLCGALRSGFFQSRREFSSYLDSIFNDSLSVETARKNLSAKKRYRNFNGAAA